MTVILFWGAAALILYAYVVFPAIVFVRARFIHCPIHAADIAPRVSLIIAAYNEAANIAAKIQNILSLDFPAECMETIIASDGSTDGTEAIVQAFAGQGIRLLSLPRQGKISALNAAVAATTGDILVFSDANSMFAPDALRVLVQPFADARVGGVAGNQVYLSGGGLSALDNAESRYWNFDRRLKKSQTEAGHVISATGAIYAIRRCLFQPLPPGVTDDFVASTRVIAQGYRLVFAADAMAFEPVARSGGMEFRRKVRVITQGLRAVIVMRGLLNPFRYGFYAIQVFSHKVLRRLMVVPLLVLLSVSALLWPEGPFFTIITLAQLGFYGAAGLGLLLRGTWLGRAGIFAMPFYFCLVNTAALVAIANLLRGRQIGLWEPQRAEAAW